MDSDDFGFIFAGASKVVSYKRNVWYNLSCLLQTYCRLSIIEKLFVSWQFFETYGVIRYGSGWRQDVVSQGLEFCSPVSAEPRSESACGEHWLATVNNSTLCGRLQALVYDILPPTTAIVDYATGLEKLSANKQFFDDAQMAVSF